MTPERTDQIERNLLALMGIVEGLRLEVERLQQERRWIPVTERLPEQADAWAPESELVLVASGYGVFTAFYRHNSKDWWENNTIPVMFSITHWQPLPAGPEE